jgi:Helix-turn-helix domain
VGLILEQRASESPFIERVWQSRSENINSFISVAAFQWDFVVWKQNGKTFVSIHGPETHATRAPVPEDAEFFGIVFRPGVFMPHLHKPSALVNGSIDLPDTTNGSFWLNSSTWELPTYDNADTFVDRLVKSRLLVREPVVESVLKGCMPYMSLRTVQRTFLRATGLTYRTMQQIERARRAAMLLREGASIADTVYQLGYFDHAHLTKSLKHFVGQTPSQLVDDNKSEELSLLYKTSAFGWDMM